MTPVIAAVFLLTAAGLWRSDALDVRRSRLSLQVSSAQGRLASAAASGAISFSFSLEDTCSSTPEIFISILSLKKVGRDRDGSFDRYTLASSETHVELKDAVLEGNPVPSQPG